MNTNLIQI
jgi:DNA-binding XRE family transcriptional regulator